MYAKKGLSYCVDWKLVGMIFHHVLSPSKKYGMGWLGYRRRNERNCFSARSNLKL